MVLPRTARPQEERSGLSAVILCSLCYKKRVGIGRIQTEFNDITYVSLTCASQCRDTVGAASRLEVSAGKEIC